MKRTTGLPNTSDDLTTWIFYCLRGFFLYPALRTKHIIQSFFPWAHPPSQKTGQINSRFAQEPRPPSPCERTVSSLINRRYLAGRRAAVFVDTEDTIRTADSGLGIGVGGGLR